jgi:hypothetical protein
MMPITAPNDQGKTLLIFNTSDTVILTRKDGRAFGPSVLAPFSNVELRSVAHVN